MKRCCAPYHAAKTRAGTVAHRRCFTAITAIIAITPIEAIDGLSGLWLVNIPQWP
jgi:hypothetical protein